MNFKCKRCGWCCRNVNINVSYSDIQRWVKERRLDILNQLSYIDHKDKKKRGFYITETVLAPKRACPFLKTKDGLAICAIYETRPRSCREFPQAHKKDEKKFIKCPARGNFEPDKKMLFTLKRDQALDFKLAEDRKKHLIEILETTRTISKGFRKLQEFSKDPTESLWVDGLGTERTGWTEVGTSPYLDAQDQPTNYVWTTTKNAEHGDFTFANSGVGTGTINSVYLYVYAASAATAQNLEFYIWDGTAWSLAGTLPDNTPWSWVSFDISTILDTWTKIDAAKLYLLQGNTTVESDVDAAYLLVDYTSGVIEKNFSDNGSGSDSFANPFRAMGFGETGGGTESFGIPFKALGFSESGQGSDAFQIPYKEMEFSDVGGGADVFFLLQEKQFSDIGGGTDVFSITYKEMKFSDAGAGTDAFTNPFRAMGFADSGLGSDSFSKVITFLNVSFSDIGQGSDVFTNPYREVKFSETGIGLDVFFLLQEKSFTDVGGGLDSFSISFKTLGFFDVGSGGDLFNVPFKSLSFSDVGAGADSFLVLLQRAFSDLGGGLDVFGKEILGGIIDKAFADAGLGADSFLKSLLKGIIITRPRAQIIDRAGIASLTTSIKKISVWEDIDGNVKYIKYYDSQGNLLFTLEFSNAGEALTERSITRS